MNRKIFAVRHGEVNYPLNEKGQRLVYPPETSLSALGKAQMNKIGDKLKADNIKLEALFVSPFIRTRESAEILRTALQIPELFIIDDLHDVHPNSWIGWPLEEYGKIEGDIYSNPKSDNQESLEHLLMRARRAIQHIVDKGEYQQVAIVSHGDLLSGMDWVLKTPHVKPSYIEMKNRFYLQKGEVAEYTIDPALQLVDEVRLITVPEVRQSLESYRQKKL